ncbi:hypothetical protein BJ742DRAFT_23870 [Cladochytrium replicatum]|nr:hypothetical protein BJ742DRAFT_23870 [Cladochytrium replicatum]
MKEGQNKPNLIRTEQERLHSATAPFGTSSEQHAYSFQQQPPPSAISRSSASTGNKKSPNPQRSLVNLRKWFAIGQSHEYPAANLSPTPTPGKHARQRSNSLDNPRLSRSLPNSSSYFNSEISASSSATLLNSASSRRSSNPPSFLPEDDLFKYQQQDSRYQAGFFVNHRDSPQPTYLTIHQHSSAPDLRPDPQYYSGYPFTVVDEQEQYYLVRRSEVVDEHTEQYLAQQFQRQLRINEAEEGRYQRQLSDTDRQPPVPPKFQQVANSAQSSPNNIFKNVTSAFRQAFPKLLPNKRQETDKSTPTSSSKELPVKPTSRTSTPPRSKAPATAASSRPTTPARPSSRSSTPSTTPPRFGPIQS